MNDINKLSEDLLLGVKKRKPTEAIEQQLELATLSFLESETKVEPEAGEIHITRLMLWFLGDFNGYRGIRKIFRQKLGIETKGQRIKFREYNWEEYLHFFR